MAFYFPKENKIISLFLLFSIVNSIVIFAGKYFLVSDQIFYNTFGEQLSYERIDQMIESQKKWEWIIYALTPIFKNIETRPEPYCTAKSNRY